MNVTGRNYFVEDASDKPRGICVLESASDNVDCLFIHFASDKGQGLPGSQSLTLRNRST
jgi:hypothetical protein